MPLNSNKLMESMFLVMLKMMMEYLEIGLNFLNNNYILIPFHKVI